MKKLILISLLLSISVCIFAQKREWVTAKRINTIQSYQDFMEKYPKSKYLEAAKIKLMDQENELKEQENENKKRIQENLTTGALNAVANEDFDKALSYFEQILELHGWDITHPESEEIPFDTIFIWNAGWCAYKAEKYETAIKYLKKVTNYKFKGETTYLLISDSYLAINDTMGSINALVEGLVKYPENNAVKVKLISAIQRKNNLIENELVALGWKKYFSGYFCTR